MVLIPLGDHCAAAICLRELGLILESMPFNWVARENAGCNSPIIKDQGCCTELFVDLVCILKETRDPLLVAKEFVSHRSTGLVWFPHDKLDDEALIVQYFRRFTRMLNALDYDNVTFVIVTRFCQYSPKLFEKLLNEKTRILLVTGVEQKENLKNVCTVILHPYDKLQWYQYDYSFWRPELTSLFKKYFTKYF